MKKIMIGTCLIVLASAGVFTAFALAGKPPAPPGKDPCSHGNTGKPCRPDPQPDRGKDCEKHGKQGGVNEDHCKGETQPPTTTTTTTTPTTPTTPQTTTTTSTNPPTTPPTQTTPGETTPIPVTPPPVKPPKSAPPKDQPGVEGPEPPAKTPNGKLYCPNGTPVYKGKCFPKAEGSG